MAQKKIDCPLTYVQVVMIIKIQKNNNNKAESYGH